MTTSAISKNNASSTVDVFVRPRPAVDKDQAIGFVVEEPVAAARNPSPKSLSIQNAPQHLKVRTWKGTRCFAGVFDETVPSSHVFRRSVEEPLDEMVHTGGAATFSAYGHTGSGKTHTIFGKPGNAGISILAARALFKHIDEEAQQTRPGGSKLGLGIKLFEMRNKTACDLLNDRSECFIREGPDGKTHIRGQTEMLEGGKVRVKPIETVACWTWEEVETTLQRGLALRTVGTSTVHDESSRTHAVLQLEIVSEALLAARQDVTEKEAELVPVGKRATDVYLEEHTRHLIKDTDGNYRQDPHFPLDQSRIDEAEALKAEYQARLDCAIQQVERCLASETYPRLGSRLVFVDLAGAEFSDDRAGSTRVQTPGERKTTRQINTDLMALKEVMRAHATRQKRIPFRGSPLTMVLREHFSAHSDHASMIATVSSNREQFSATLNTLRFASLVGARA